MIVVQIARDFQKIDLSPPRLEKLVRAICRRFKLTEAVISIAIVDDAQLRTLNARFLGCRRVSDCLSFELSDTEEPGSPRSFELVVNGEMAVRQAGLRGHSGEAEVALYTTHAMLHNLGFDDSTAEQSETMHNTEDEILQHFGYGAVYNRRPRA